MDGGLLRLRFLGGARGLVRTPLLRERLHETPLSGRVLLRAARLPTDGLLQPEGAPQRGPQDRARVLPPDIHLSEEDFAVEEGGTTLRPGLRYCKGLSEKAISSILSERHKKPFSSVADLYGRTAVEKDSLENLIRGGFLDSLAGGFDRSRLLGETATLAKKRRPAGQSEIPIRHPASWWAVREKRSVERLPLADTAKERMEWEVLGLNIHRHPLAPYRDALRELVWFPARSDGPAHGTRARAAGLIDASRTHPRRVGIASSSC